MSRTCGDLPPGQAPLQGRDFVVPVRKIRNFKFSGSDRMPEDRVDRRLAAIFAGDIAGYSRLMGTDEEGTLRPAEGAS